MRELVNAMDMYVQGQTSLEDLGKAVRRAFSRKRSSV